jgi:hypothetical protein
VARESNQEELRDLGEERFGEKFIESLYVKTKDRYAEYRQLMLDADTGLWKPFHPIIFDISRHLIRPTSSLAQDERRLLQFKLGIAAVDHLSHCSKTF